MIEKVNKLVEIMITTVQMYQEAEERTDIDNELIDKALDAALKMPLFEDIDEEAKNLARQRIRSIFITKFTDIGAVLSDNSIPKWLDDKRGEISWDYWNAYKRFLEIEKRPKDVIDENSKIIDRILDMSGDPTTPGQWSRKGLVMGNVQSGKTQNFIGLLNKAADVGYKVIIVLGGHQNELRKQTQERIDEGLVGRESRHLARIRGGRSIGVGEYRPSNKVLHSFTSTESDFSKTVAKGINYSFGDVEGAPIVFCVKKIAPILRSLKEWLTESQGISESQKHKAPLLFIDDEADYASINSKEASNQITAVNASIRGILNLFERSTYVGYSATPFANIFIDPDSEDEMLGQDLYPKNFLIRIPTPEAYCGQDYYFPNHSQSEDFSLEPVKTITDNEDFIPMSGQKKETVTGSLPISLEKAIRCFIINIAVKKLRQESGSVPDNQKHDTLLVNMTHLNIHQATLRRLIKDYVDACVNHVSAYHGLGPEKSLSNSFMKEIKATLEEEYLIEETWEDLLPKLNWAVNKIKVFIVNSSPKDALGIPSEPLDYSLYEKGLAAIAIGGHKLSRGLTLEGLSVSYFARNSRSYDTLMQMCRWFGYRPGYKDICKLFTPRESVEWYEHISDAIRDLYSELDRMIELGRTPSDFGLKIRNHPGLLISQPKIGLELEKLNLLILICGEKESEDLDFSMITRQMIITWNTAINL